MQNTKTILITGGSGFVGSHLIKHLKRKNYNVRILSRSKKSVEGVEVFLWDVNKMQIDERAVVGADYIVHLAGAGIADKKWTDERKKELYSSRIDSGKLILDVIEKTGHKPEAVVCASASGIYESSQQGINEGSPLANDFTGNLCCDWEQQNFKFESAGMRTIILRFGLVMSADGGVLKELLKPMKFFIAPVFGNGKQFMPWIEIGDLCNLITFCLEVKTVHGIFNAVAPQKIPNGEIISELQKHVRPSFKFYVPAFVLKIMLGKRADMLLNSYPLVADKILGEGFGFRANNICKLFDPIINPLPSV